MEQIKFALCELDCNSPAGDVPLGESPKTHYTLQPIGMKVS